MESFVAFICKRVLDSQVDNNLEFDEMFRREQEIAQEEELKALKYHYEMNPVSKPKKSWFASWFK